MIQTQGARKIQADLYQWHRVVIVDDDPGILSALRRLLEREPYEVITMSRPEAVLGWLATKDVSLVIADQRMPGMTGLEFLEKVWRISPTTAGVLLTGYPDIPETSPESRDRLEGIIRKPWNEGILKHMIRRLLHEHESRRPPPGAHEGGRPSDAENRR